MNQRTSDIDFVITWVDGNDPIWLEDKQRYSPKNTASGEANRFRDWGTLRYLLRGIEVFAPWVHKVHLITCGHYPEWLNLDNPKLNPVRHSDYIPSEYLPTFSSHPIELNMHRIKGLSEHFVYFNDDMFITDDVAPDDFFKNGLPCGACGFEVINPAYDFNFYNILRNNMNVICRNFNGRDFIKSHKDKLFNVHYSPDHIKTLLLLPWCQDTITGFINPHLPTAYLKHTFSEVWEKEPEILSETCTHKFRNPHDVSPFLFTYWQYMTGRFNPINMKKMGAFYYMEKDKKSYNAAIRRNRHKLICLNDDLESEDNAEFLKLQKKLLQSFEAILPHKSSFEKE